MDGYTADKGQAPARAPSILQGKGAGRGTVTLTVSTGCNTGTDEDTEIEKMKLRRGRYMKDKGTDAQKGGMGAEVCRRKGDGQGDGERTGDGHDGNHD